MKKILSRIVFSAAMLATVAANAQLYLTASSGEVVPGEWNSNFAAAKAYAEANHMPMVVFWVNDGCAQCAKLERACNESDFTAWQATRKIVMVFTTASDAKSFARNSSGNFPYICAYWPKANGDTVLVRFTGRKSSMPVSGSSLQAAFMNSLDYYFSGWTGDGSETTPETSAEPTIADPFAGNQSYSFAYYADGGTIPTGVAHIKAGKVSSNRSRLTGKIYLNNGKTATLKSQYVTVGDGYATATLVFGSAASIPVTIKATTIEGDTIKNLTIGGDLSTSTPTLHMDASGFSVPDGYECVNGTSAAVGFTVSGTKWNFGKKPSVKYAKADGAWVLQGFGDANKPNAYQVSGSYKSETGFFKGSCKYYLTNACCTDGKPKIKKVSLKFYGFVVNGIGIGYLYSGSTVVGTVGIE